MSSPGSPELPLQLRAKAFVSEDELAWLQQDCPDTIDWLRQNGFALLGTELWLIEDGTIRTAIKTASGPVIYVTACDPQDQESWSAYVQRSARHALETIEAFAWPEDSLEPKRPAYLNLCWADLGWFRAQKTHAAYFADER
jgi:hypothetical protein